MSTEASLPPAPAPAPATPLPYDFEASVGYWVVLSAHAFHKALNEELAPHGITYRQSQVLGWLALDGDLSQVDLAGRMMIEPATLVGVLDRMERDDLIRRCASPKDRRLKIVRANPQAAEVWAQVASCARRVRARAVRGMDATQIESLMATLRVILDNLREGEPDHKPEVVKA